MIQYLLNTTAIWLVSLLCFDLLLKRETYHGLNRAYLLLTIMAGLLVPLYSIPSFATTHIVQQPLQSVAGIKTSIVQTITPQEEAGASHTPGIQWTHILLWIYLAGAALSLLFLLRELSLLLRYYRSGKKSKLGAYTIVETCRDHGPFSVGRYIFISSKKNYDPEQWQIVLQHEQMHYKLLHLADLLLVQSVQVVFWFHPLVYLYRHRLLMVHEYQADAATTAPPAYYGHFLLEQALLQHGPLPAHAFNRSPIKNRLIMLTKNASSGISRIKYWLMLPGLALCLICCAKTRNYIAYERKKEGNKLTYKGNTFEMTAAQNDTITILDPTTGKETQMVSTREPYPAKMNGAAIAEESKVDTKPIYKGKEKDLATTVFKYIEPDLEKLDDGDYTISMFNIIVGKDGKLAYYEVGGIVNAAKSFVIGETNGKPSIVASPDDLGSKKQEDQKAEEAIAQKIDQYLANEDIQFSPAMDKGQAVPCVVEAGFSFERTIVVKNHQATMIDKKR